MKIIFSFLFSVVLVTVYSSHIPTLTHEEWEVIAPYILPDSHPIKPAVDKIFAVGRPVRNLDTLKEAGFNIITKGHWSETIIARHPEIYGFYVKLYIDEQDHVNEINRLMARVKGAKVAERLVEQHQWHKIFKVPRKWLYLLPDDPNPIPDRPSKRMILLAEDMRILSKKDNYRKWEQPNLDKKIIDAVFQLLIEGGFSDSPMAFNLPFTKDGRIAVIDNEKYNKHPVPCHKLLHYLSPKSKRHWKHLIERAGPDLAF